MSARSLPGPGAFGGGPSGAEEPSFLATERAKARPAGRPRGPLSRLSPRTRGWDRREAPARPPPTPGAHRDVGGTRDRRPASCPPVVRGRAARRRDISISPSGRRRGGGRKRQRRPAGYTGGGGGGRAGVAGALTSACCRGSVPAPRSRRTNRRAPGSARGAVGRGCRRPRASPRPPAPGAARGAPQHPFAPPGRPSPDGRRPPLCPASRAPSARAPGPRGPPTAGRFPGAGALRADAGGKQRRPEGGRPSGRGRRAQGRPGAGCVLSPAGRSARSERAVPGRAVLDCGEARPRGGRPGGRRWDGAPAPSAGSEPTQRTAPAAGESRRPARGPRLQHLPPSSGPPAGRGFLNPPRSCVLARPAGVAGSPVPSRSHIHTEDQRKPG